MMVVSSKLQEVTECSSFDNRCVDSKGIPEQSTGIFTELLRRMNPGTCLNACGGQVDFSFSSSMKSSVAGSSLRSIVPDLVAAIDLEKKKSNHPSALQRRKRNLALKSMYELSIRKQNRVPLVCTQKYLVIPTLAMCLGSTLLDEKDNEGTRRLLCLTLNQLSLPFQNKKVMVLGNGSNTLIENLLHIINSRLPETYLCCICLMNLTYLETTIDTIINASTQVISDANTQFARSASKRPNNIDPKEWNNFPSAVRVPAVRAPSPAKGYHIRGSDIVTSCLDCSKSLLRSIETLMQEHGPFLMSKVLSEEGEAIRWSTGLMRNLTKTEVHCSIIAKTEIPFLILSFIRESSNPMIRWTKDSLEEMSLEVIGNMASFEVTRSLLETFNAIEILKQLDEECKRLGLSLNTARTLKSLCLN